MNEDALFDIAEPEREHPPLAAPEIDLLRMSRGEVAERAEGSTWDEREEETWIDKL